MYNGNRVTLRQLRKEDLNFILNYVNDYEIYSTFTDSPVTPKSFEYQKNWLENPHPSIITFAIEENENHKIIGTAQLRNLCPLSDKAVLSIIIGDLSSQGKGYGTESIKLLLQYAFYELNLNKVSLLVYEDNLGAVALYEKSGFIREGLLMEEVFNRGTLRNQIQYSILKDEFKSGPYGEVKSEQ